MTEYYKAFDKDFKCRGYQYEVGETYIHDGSVEICESGFHCCENPLDVLNYYDLTNSRFGVVIPGGEQVRHDTDSKVASAKITVSAEITLPEFIRRAVDYIIDICSSADVASGDYSRLAASGDYSRLAASGYYSQLAASGHDSRLAASGERSIIASTGLGSRVKGVAGTAVAAPYKDSSGQYRFATGVIGENGLKPDTWYHVNNAGQFVEDA